MKTIDQFKQYVIEDIHKAQRILSSNMLLLESIHELNTDEIERQYTDVMDSIDKLMEIINDG